MKRKIFSKLLMGAFLIASVSMFVSCKDYDDDISKVNADVAALKTSLDSQIKTLTDALNQAKTDAATAHATFATKVELANAQSALEDASEANATAIKANVDAINALKEAVAASATVAQLEQAVAELKALAEAQINEEELAAALAILSAQIDAINEDLNTLKTDVPALKAWKETVDASVLAVTTDLATQKAAIEALQAAMTGKADAAAVEAIVAQLATKADASAVEAVVAALGGKADASAVQTALAGKADAAAIATLTDAIKDLNSKLAGKLDANSLKGLANEEVVKNYIAEQLKAYAKAGVVDASTTTAINNALKSYKTADELTKILGDYATSANVDSKIAEALKAYYTVNQLDKQAEDAKKYIDDQIKAVKDAAITETQIKTIADASSKKVQDTMGAKLDVLNVFVSKKLSSIVLKPEFYWEGIEGIEIPTLYQNRVFKDAGGTLAFTWEYNGVVEPIKYVVAENMAWLQNDNKTLVKVIDKVAANEGLSVQNLINTDSWNYNNRVQKYLYRYKTNYSEDPGSFVAAGSTTGKDKIINISKGGVANYHLNPSNANLEGATYDFFGNVAPVYTRAGNSIVTKVGTPTAANGILSVPFEVDVDKLEKYYANYLLSFDWNTNKYTWADARINADKSPVTGNYDDPATMTDDDNAKSKLAYRGDLPFISLQVGLPADKEKNIEAQTINSDYALVTPARYANLVLADNNVDLNILPHWNQQTWNNKEDYGTVTRNHLYRTAPSAIVSNATHQVIYNGQIDLKPFIETHVDYITLAKYGESLADKKMTDADLKALGLAYKFTIVDYTVGTNVTGESKHIAQISDGVFAPKSVKSDPNDQKDETRREAVGREPLIRVDLVDTNNNNQILTYGYIKLRIVDTLPQTYFADIDLGEAWMNCGSVNRVTWSQIEDLILYQLADGKGLLKQEFEEQYYLDQVGGNTWMPYGPTSSIYTDGWQAKRFTTTDWDKAVTNKDASSIKVVTDATKYYGNVWYTPMDQAAWSGFFDEMTNVIEWNLDDVNALAGNNMNAAKYKQMMNDLKVTIGNTDPSYDGANKEQLTTIIRFLKKNEVNEANAIYVRLKFSPKNIHFQYASVANKDLHHWYKFNTITPGTQSDIDTRANVPTPAEVNFAMLDNTTFNKDLLEYWQNKADIVKLAGGADHFSKFYEADKKTQKITPEFYFTLPQEGKNSTISYKTVAKITAKGNSGVATDYTNVWYVKGISGSTWTLALDKSSRTGKANQAIVAIQQDGKTLDPVQPVVEFYAPSKVHYFGDQKKDNGTDTQVITNDAATDLLNQMGRRNETGADQSADGYYLTANIDRTFTAYIEIKLTDDPCYEPLVKDNLFNVKFLRPINVWGNQITWTDALNQIEKVKISDLVNIVDWRDYPVIAKDSESGLPYHNKSAADKTQYNNAKAFKEGLTPYEFYGITDLAIIRDEIRSDAWEEYTVRVAAPVADPSKFPTIDKISSLTSADYTQHYLKVLDGNGVEVDKNSTNKFTVGKGGTDFGSIEYTNNGGNAQIFHIYVPIAIKYNWGNIKFKYTNDDKSTNINKNKNYTQTVWAVITVNKTVGQVGHEARQR